MHEPHYVWLVDCDYGFDSHYFKISEFGYVFSIVIRKWYLKIDSSNLWLGVHAVWVMKHLVTLDYISSSYEPDAEKNLAFLKESMFEISQTSDMEKAKLCQVSLGFKSSPTKTYNVLCTLLCSFICFNDWASNTILL
jgi:hypothetical protein